ncbi:MAG TPA: hypothetical protein VHE60_10220, partial [Pyrinomonadaceae bacterium]|nr:hypothetical protein [Pyrinomonadaceae bacterium]
MGWQHNPFQRGNRLVHAKVLMIHCHELLQSALAFAEQREVFDEVEQTAGLACAANHRFKADHSSTQLLGLTPSH